jgi:hypothetical protein
LTPTVSRQNRNADQEYDGGNDDPDRKHQISDNRKRERSNDPGHAVTKSETARHARDIGRSNPNP